MEELGQELAVCGTYTIVYIAGRDAERCIQQHACGLPTLPGTPEREKVLEDALKNVRDQELARKFAAPRSTASTASSKAGSPSDFAFEPADEGLANSWTQLAA